MNPTTVTLGEARLSYCNVFRPAPPFNNPNGEPKFSVTILVPKSNLQAKAVIDAAVNTAMEQGVSKCWGGVRPPMPAICVHDGDGPRPSDGQTFGPECKGHWVFTASSKVDRPPFVVDLNVQPIVQQSEIYSGVYGNVNVTFFAYANSGKKGVGCGLNGIQKTRDGEPLGNTVTAQDAFGSVAAAGAMPATPGYAVPGVAQPPMAAPTAYPQQTAPAPAYPAYAQQTAPVPGYPQQQVDPFAVPAYHPTGFPVMGM